MRITNTLYMNFNFKYFSRYLLALLFSVSSLASAQTISATNGNQAGGGAVPCSDCVPAGWIDNGGTPDVSNRTIAATNTTAGGGANWTTSISSSDNLSLPLPPNNHNTWLSLRDLGPPPALEESVNTTITGLVVGRTYEVVVYSLTAVTRNNGLNGAKYAGSYNNNFFAEVAGQTLEAGNLTQNTWGTSRLKFTATQASHVMILRPGADATGTNYQTVQVSVTINAVNAIPIATADYTQTLQGVPVSLNVVSNDSDPDGTINVATVDLNPATPGPDTTFTNAQGTWTVNASGVITFAPVPAFTGVATLPYTIKDNYTLDGVSNPSTSNSATISIAVLADSDNDGIPNDTDLDDDNDGILDTLEGCAGTVTVATVNTTLASSLATNNTVVFPLVPPGSVGLPEGGVRITRTAGGNGWSTFTPPVQNASLSIGGSAIATTFSTTYLDVTGTVARALTIDFGANARSISSTNNEYQYIIGIAGLGNEGASITSTFSVPLTVIQNVDVFNTGRFSLFGGVTPVPGQTGTVFSTATPNTGPNQAQGYTFFFVPKDVASFIMTIAGANDPHGFIFGVYRQNCTIDTDGDGVLNNLDTDSDNDGCPDAVEGSEAVRITQVYPMNFATVALRGRIKVIYDGLTVDNVQSRIVSNSPLANGVPQLVNNAGNNLNTATNPSNLAGIVDNTDSPTPTADIGQDVGTSQNNSVKDIECERCFRPGATGPGTLQTSHGITALTRGGVANGNWPMKINGAYTALDARTKGFVINRLTDVEITAIPTNTLVVGMMVFDKTANCLKVYDGTNWACYTKPTCDNLSL